MQARWGVAAGGVSNGPPGEGAWHARTGASEAWSGVGGVACTHGARQGGGGTYDSGLWGWLAAARWT